MGVREGPLNEVCIIARGVEGMKFIVNELLNISHDCLKS